MMMDFEVERSIFSHVSILLLELEATKVKLLVITLRPFMLELSVSTAKNVLEPVTLHLISEGSLDIKNTLFPSLVHASEFELSVVQVQVTVSPGHTDCLSQSIEVVFTVNNNTIVMKHNMYYYVCCI
jgi:hypothetical protein